MLQAERRIQQIARREGLPFSLDRLNANTFDFHRVVHYAEEAGKGWEFSLVQDRFFAGSLDPFDADALAEVGEEIGLSGDRVREILAGDEYTEAVRADAREGRELGAQGVPFAVVDRRLAAAGAQSVTAYGQVLDQIVEAGVA